MPFISSLKESFATAPIQDREAIVKKLSTANTDDAKYYEGLLLLQKIYDEVMKQENTTQPREPTNIERDLSDKMSNLLKKKWDYGERYNELETRYHLLIYPFETAKSLAFIKDRLYLDLITQKQEEQQQVEQDQNAANNTFSKLDNDLISGFNVIKQSFDQLKMNGTLDLDVLSFPELKTAVLDKNLLSDDEEVELMKKLFMHPTEKIFGNSIIDRLIRVWKLPKAEDQSVWRLGELSFSRMTLSQQDHLIKNIPNIVLLHENFIRAYLEKLIPAAFFDHYTSNQRISFWDDDEGILQEYINRVDSFVKQLPDIYFELKSAVKFHQLRVDIVRQNFEEINLIQFLAGASDKSVSASPIPSRVANIFSFTQSNQPNNNGISVNTSIEIPCLGSCKIQDSDKFLVVKEYLTGLITQGKFTTNIESLGAYMDYHHVLKPLYAKIMLTTSPTIQQSWVSMLPPPTYESLVTESSVTFTPATLNASVKRKPDDAIRLSIRTKNIQSLSIRVFQINTENYCRVHINSDNNIIADRNNKIDLDGLCPTWEKTIDFRSESAIHVKTNDFEFGGNGFAPDIFTGRGLWVIEFVGGQNQCRTIVQKGYLKHISQKTTAGHVVRVLDESNKPLANAKIWCNNHYYKSDKSNNILIPYLSFKEQPKASKVLMISISDDFCESANFHHMAENYSLEADFYVNPEMVSYNKKATVIVTPRLNMNTLRVPLSLLEQISLTVKCTNVNDVSNTTALQNTGKNSDAIYFEFMVPDRLTELEFTLQAKIKTLNDTLQTISVDHSIRYNSPIAQSGVGATVQLRKSADGNYSLYAFGKNGEPKKGYEATLKLKHAYVQYRRIEFVLKSNDSGIIDLGKLANIQFIEYYNSFGYPKTWSINNEKRTLLPPSICVSATTPFKISYQSSALSDSIFSLYKIGVRDIFIQHIPGSITEKDGYLSISGLPQGEYMLHTVSVSEGVKNIKCTVIEHQVEASDNQVSDAATTKKNFWSDWVIGNHRYGKQNGIILQRPLDISAIDTLENDSISIRLKNWSSKSFVVVTTSLFVPTRTESLGALLEYRLLEHAVASNNRVLESKTLFLNDKKLGEEYQYVLNRARSEKWVGGNLTKPSLLIYPKKNSSTTANTRQLQQNKMGESRRAKEYNIAKQLEFGGKRYARYATSHGDNSVESSLACLDTYSPIMILPISADGTVVIERKLLGNGGNLLQVVAFSGDQAVYKTAVLSGPNEIRYNDLRQKPGSNKTLVRSKVAKSVLPNEKLVLNTSEYQVIDSFEKLFETIKTISNVGDSLTQEFGYLKTWSSLDIEKKLKLHEEKACHELNFWLKKKDPVFFEQFIASATKSKIQKSFMDLYLIEADLSEYSNNLYKYNQLNTIEKVLLAESSSSEFAETVLRSFKEAFDEKKIDDRSDAIFDSILAGSALALPIEAVEAVEEVEVVEAVEAVEEYKESDDDMGFATFDVSSAPLPSAAPVTRSAAFYAPAAGNMFGAAKSAVGGLFGSAPQQHVYKSANHNPTQIQHMQAQMQAQQIAAAQAQAQAQNSRAYNTQSLAYSPTSHGTFVDGQVDNEDSDLQEAANELREKAKQQQKKVDYKFTEPTSEWVETEYYNSQDAIHIKKFWIDYLEHHINRGGDMFLSENFVYSVDNLTEIMYMLSLMNLPFASETKWTMEVTKPELSYESGKGAVKLAICASKSHPLMVFYRTLTEGAATEAASNTLMLGQELFIYDENTQVDSDECLKINPSADNFDSLVEYGNHVIISNASSKTLTCQVTVQVPIGSVPCRDTPYCKSTTVSIGPYSTWHEVVASFYFPSAGDYIIVPVTVSNLSGSKILGKIDAVNVKVIDKSSSNDNDDLAGENTQSLSLSSWPTLANSGSSANVISFIKGYKKLDRIDFGMIEYRMKEKVFARQLFDVLTNQRCFFSRGLWKYGVYHQFDDIVRDLLNFDGDSILEKTGQIFESPLVTRKREDHTQIYDYYPILNARAHPLKATSNEILNTQFYGRYDKFLSYLCQRSTDPSNSDLVILTTYLILQDRIGEALATFSRIQADSDNGDCQIQIDYLGVYLKTRIPVSKLMDQQFEDLQSVKEITSKYKDFGVLKWRRLFAELYEFVREVEQGDMDMVENIDSSRIHSEPILEFEIDQQKQELTIQHANTKAIDIKYYDVNIEVMFSTNPFMNDRSASMLTKESFTWVKPSYSSRIDLYQKPTAAVSDLEDDDYNIIGAGQLMSVQSTKVPFDGGNKNIFIEITTVDTPNVIKRRQAYFSHTLQTHISESFGIVRAVSGTTKRPLPGAYVKVYAKMKNSHIAHFWKDGYTGLNGVFDYIGVTEGNAMVNGETELKNLMDEKIDKFSILVMSADEGAVVKEAYPPLT